MTPSRFQVVLLGMAAANQDLQQVKQNVAQFFHLSLEKVEPYFRGKTVIVKRDVDQSTAERFKKALEKLGAPCRIEPFFSQTQLAEATLASPPPAIKAPAPPLLSAQTLDSLIAITSQAQTVAVSPPPTPEKPADRLRQQQEERRYSFLDQKAQYEQGNLRRLRLFSLVLAFLLILFWGHRENIRWTRELSNAQHRQALHKTSPTAKTPLNQTAKTKIAPAIQRELDAWDTAHPQISQYFHTLEGDPNQWNSLRRTLSPEENTLLLERISLQEKASGEKMFSPPAQATNKKNKGTR